MMKSNINFKKGLASIFIVVFTALLLGLITLSFARLMIKDQQRATNSDLSQSAYDSALAGVEDAKRAIVRFYKDCLNSPGTDECTKKLADSLSGEDCDAISSLLGEAKPTSGSDYKIADANQYYTCVKIKLNTLDYVGEMSKPGHQFTVPLKAKAGETIKSLRISWYNQSDLENSSNPVTLSPNPTDGMYFKTDTEWMKNNTPPVIIANYFKLADNLSKYDINSPIADRSSWQLYLYPLSDVNDLATFSLDTRGGSNKEAVIVKTKCDPTFAGASGFACTQTIELPAPITDSNTSWHYLRIAKRYSSKANFKVEMLNSAGNPVYFDGVQPEIDSNGRANDIFRRVIARVEPIPDAGAPYPTSAVEIGKGDFCKKVTVGDSVDFGDAANCNVGAN